MSYQRPFIGMVLYKQMPNDKNPFNVIPVTVRAVEKGYFFIKEDACKYSMLTRNKIIDDYKPTGEMLFNTSCEAVADLLIENEIKNLKALLNRRNLYGRSLHNLSELREASKVLKIVI